MVKTENGVAAICWKSKNKRKYQIQSVFFHSIAIRNEQKASKLNRNQTFFYFFIYIRSVCIVPNVSWYHVFGVIFTSMFLLTCWNIRKCINNFVIENERFLTIIYSSVRTFYDVFLSTENKKKQWTRGRCKYKSNTKYENILSTLYQPISIYFQQHNVVMCICIPLLVFIGNKWRWRCSLPM